MYICIDWQLMHDFVFQELHFHEWEYGLGNVHQDILGKKAEPV